MVLEGRDAPVKYMTVNGEKSKIDSENIMYNFLLAVKAEMTINTTRYMNTINIVFSITQKTFFFIIFMF